MDTLCIPVDPRDERLKVQTIHNMASIYTMASSVLILDSGLMTLNCRRLTSGLLAHMICSVWMQRSWTLQEGILAERCVFQFSNKAVMLSRGIASHGRDYSLAWTADLEDGSAREIGGRVEVPRLEEGSGQNGNSLGLGKIFLDSLVQKIISFHPKVEHGMRKDVTLNAARFASIWNALAGRSTTMTGDLYLILANVLNIQTAPLGKLSTTQEKLQHIIFSFPTLPVSLLFNTGEKHADNQNRFNGWLPAELSRDILSSQPTMSFHGSHNVLEFSDLGNGFETYLISSVALLRQSFVVDTESDRPLLNVQVISTSFADREMPNELACIIIEHTKLGSETLTRGACFLISKISYGKYTYRPRVQLIYHAPVRAQRLSATSQTKSSRSKPVFTASEVSDCGLKFWLGYGMYDHIQQSILGLICLRPDPLFQTSRATRFRPTPEVLEVGHGNLIFSACSYCLHCPGIRICCQDTHLSFKLCYMCCSSHCHILLHLCAGREYGPRAVSAVRPKI
jgi:hypothetical protein